jgi:hypothetical protein
MAPSGNPLGVLVTGYANDPIVFAFPNSTGTAPNSTKIWITDGIDASTFYIKFTDTTEIENVFWLGFWTF